MYRFTALLASFAMLMTTQAHAAKSGNVYVHGNKTYTLVGPTAADYTKQLYGGNSYEWSYGSGIPDYALPDSNMGYGEFTDHIRQKLGLSDYQVKLLKRIIIKAYIEFWRKHHGGPVSP